MTGSGVISGDWKWSRFWCLALFVQQGMLLMGSLCSRSPHRRCRDSLVSALRSEALPAGSCFLPTFLQQVSEPHHSLKPLPAHSTSLLFYLSGALLSNKPLALLNPFSRSASQTPTLSKKKIFSKSPSVIGL